MLLEKGRCREGRGYIQVNKLESGTVLVDVPARTWVYSMDSMDPTLRPGRKGLHWESGRWMLVVGWGTSDCFVCKTGVVSVGYSEEVRCWGFYCVRIAR